jgi:hypothetical protein
VKTPRHWHRHGGDVGAAFGGNLRHGGVEFEALWVCAMGRAKGPLARFCV